MGAAADELKFSGIGVRYRAGAVTYCWNVPGWKKPDADCFAHRPSRPSTQVSVLATSVSRNLAPRHRCCRSNLYVPQLPQTSLSHLIPTRSLILNPYGSASGPTCTTLPTPSWPPTCARRPKRQSEANASASASARLRSALTVRDKKRQLPSICHYSQIRMAYAGVSPVEGTTLVHSWAVYTRRSAFGAGTSYNSMSTSPTSGFGVSRSRIFVLSVPGLSYTAAL